MKKVISYLSVAAFTAVLFSCSGGNSENQATESTEAQTEESSASEMPSPTGIYTVNTEESQLMWAGNMLEVGGVTLYGHTGTIDFAKGEVKLDNGMITAGTFVVDMKSITPTDENYKADEGSRAEDLVGHLSSNDFFNVAEYPMSTFSIGAGDQSSVKGEMTIRDKTNSEAIRDISMKVDGNRVILKGNMTIDRQKYDVAFEMPAKDKILSDDIDMEFMVVLDKNEAM